jgi:hypothetical protein
MLFELPGSKTVKVGQSEGDSVTTIKLQLDEEVFGERGMGPSCP